jgi:hypothetical protein
MRNREYRFPAVFPDGRRQGRRNPARKALEVSVYIELKCLAYRSGAFSIHGMSEKILWKEIYF